ncbi:DsbC family protein [Ramlibacter humi]|uniref:Thiol:disulfide interchange protein n=1 Tax=Ramlibacter humi TaxID=2530451 RepID=A0A4Z0BPV0_9BURK|nr:DsbC family protein [Ramlibacter humi]TFZ00085.1 DsbC family protein [Ramlibacter humi]
MAYRWTALGAAAALTCAACQGTTTETDQAVLARLQAAYPGAAIESAHRSPIASLYEVKAGSEVLYADASGRYVIFGRLHDMQAASAPDAAAPSPQAGKAPAAVLRELIDSAEASAIKTVHGSGANKLYVFSDPQCPHCRSLEPELARLKDVTIYTFLFPVLSPDSREIARTVWCSADRAAAWKQALAGRRLAAPETACSTPIEDNVRMARALGIRGTPTLLRADGQMLVGYQSAETLTKQFQEVTR